MTKNEAMQMALETLDNMVKVDWHEWDEFASVEDFVRWAKSRASFTAEALRTALAQPKQEPQHKLICPTCKADRTKVDCQGNRMNCGLKFEAHTAQSEPAAWLILATTEPTPIDVMLHAEVVEEIANPIVPLYTAPPQRKPLSEKVIWDIASHYFDADAPYDGVIEYSRAIEVAHGIKD